MKWGRHYQFKIKPKWQRLIARPSDTAHPAAVFSGGRGDNPWWDCADIDTKIEMGDMPKSANCWKVIILNPGTVPIQFRNTIQYFVPLKGIKEILLHRIENF